MQLALLHCAQFFSVTDVVVVVVVVVVSFWASRHPNKSGFFSLPSFCTILCRDCFSVEFDFLDKPLCKLLDSQTRKFSWLCRTSVLRDRPRDLWHYWNTQCTLDMWSEPGNYRLFSHRKTKPLKLQRTLRLVHKTITRLICSFRFKWGQNSRE